MPTYEFRCPNGHAFERFYRKISDSETEVPCPECGAPAQRQMSAGAGLLFKGSGFYLTDYGRNAHRSGSAGGSKGGTEGGTAGESKPKSTDSGTASKSDAAAPAKKPDSKPGS